MAQALGRDGDRERPALDGMLNILKPPGMTSHDVVSFIRRRLPKGTKVGHAGTLDPAAAGVLLVLAGRATRLSDYVMALDKEYRALVVFGTETDTGDGEGAVVSRSPAGHLTARDLAEIFPEFTGPITQVPPATSAVKVGGQPLYRRVRRGEQVEAPARPVMVHYLRLLEWHHDQARPRALVDIGCSAGTYIRSLARDWGRRLGTGAYLHFLLRLAVGPWDTDRAWTLDELPGVGETPAWRELLIPPAEAVAFLPAVELAPDQARAAAHGRPLGPRPAAEWPAGVAGAEAVRLLDGAGRLVAVARPRLTKGAGGAKLALWPRQVLLRPHEVQCS